MVINGKKWLFNLECQFAMLKDYNKNLYNVLKNTADPLSSGHPQGTGKGPL